MDQMLDTASALVVVFAVALLALTWNRISERVPTHFDFAGHLDGWGPKWMMALGPVLALGFYIGLGIAYKYPHRYNYAWPIRQQNAEAQHRLARSLIAWEKFWVVLIFGYIAWAQVQVATGNADMLNGTIMLVLVAGTLLTVIICMIQMHRAK
jgi:hypothetical protein